MKHVLVLLVLSVLISCQSAPTPFVAEPLNFSRNGAPITLNIAEIRIAERYQSPMPAPNMEQNFPILPSAALKQWVAQRMRTGGTQGILEVSIDDASAKEVLLPPTTEGLSGIFTYDQAARYDANIHVTFRLYDGVNETPLATGDVVVSRSKSISQKASVEDHQRLYDDMLRDMMQQFDPLAVERLNQYFSTYIVKPN